MPPTMATVDEANEAEFMRREQAALERAEHEEARRSMIDQELIAKAREAEALSRAAHEREVWSYQKQHDAYDSSHTSSASSFEEVTETDDDACEMETSSSSSSSDRSRAADPVGGRATNPLSALSLIQ